MLKPSSSSSMASRISPLFRLFTSSTNNISFLRLRHTKRNSLDISFSSRLLNLSISASASSQETLGAETFHTEVGNPSLPRPSIAKLSFSDKYFFLLAFFACSTSVAFMGLFVAAVPTMFAMGRAATSLSKLAETAREELPCTMAAIRLSGMEISDFSQEIVEGVTKSSQAVEAAEAGIRQIGALARKQTISMIQERASLPIVSLQPVVVGASKKTSRVVERATKSLMSMISGADDSSESEDLNDK